MKPITGYFFTKKGATDFYLFSSSKAAPVIQDIVNNVDQMVNVESKQSSHKNKFVKKMS
jgi:hypothetical protein